VRLAEAARLLAHRAGTVSEVAYGVGFNSIAHFSRAFRAAYGVPPSEYTAQAGAARETA
jgi:AraC-like DNA-binding protein